MASRATDVPAFPARRTDPFDVPSEYSKLRQETPVSKVRLEDGSEPWLVTGYRQAREVLGSRRFSSDPARPGYPQSLPTTIRRDGRAFRTLIRMDPPEHTRYRR